MAIMKAKSDAEIQRLVSQELEWDPRVDTSGISVQVKEGLVTLKGSVASYANKVAARNAAHRVEGVLDVADETQIKAGGAVKSDQELALAVRRALEWDAYVPDTRIKSTVSNGWVTLDGDVDYMYQRVDATRVIERLSGVRGLTNRIVVKPQVIEPARIRASIEKALARRAAREASRIRIEVDGSTVRLSGTVDSWAERKALEGIALHSPGVTSIENSIVIDPYA